MPLKYEIPWSRHPTWFHLRSRHQGTTGSSNGVMMPKSPKLASYPRTIRPARARPMAHRIGGKTPDPYLSAQFEIESGLSTGREIWGRHLTTRGLKLGSQKGVILAAQNEPKSGCPQLYISTPAWRSDQPFHTQSTRSPTETPMTLAAKDLHATRPDDSPNWVHNCQNGKIVHTHFGLAP